MKNDYGGQSVRERERSYRFRLMGSRLDDRFVLHIAALEFPDVRTDVRLVWWEGETRFMNVEMFGAPQRVAVLVQWLSDYGVSVDPVAGETVE